MTIGFDKILIQAEKQQAIPSFFEITPTESFKLIRELHICESVRKWYTFTQPDDSGTHIKLRLFGHTLQDYEIRNIANDWYRGKVGFYYKDCRIDIVKPIEPKKVEPLYIDDEKFRRKLVRIRN